MNYEAQPLPLKKEIILVPSHPFFPGMSHVEWIEFVQNKADILMEIECEDGSVLVVRIGK